MCWGVMKEVGTFWTQATHKGYVWHDEKLAFEQRCVDFTLDTVLYVNKVTWTKDQLESFLFGYVHVF